MEGFDLVPLKTKNKSVRYAMSNSFGFGGTNASPHHWRNRCMIKGLIRLFSRLFIFTSLTGVIAVLGVSVWFYDYRTQPGIVAEDKLFFVRPGTNHNQLKQALRELRPGALHGIILVMRFSYSLVDDASFQPKAGEFFHTCALH